MYCVNVTLLSSSHGQKAQQNLETLKPGSFRKLCVKQSPPSPLCFRWSCWTAFVCVSICLIILIHNIYIAPNPIWRIHQISPIQRQQQSTGKHAHIPEQLMQSSHAVQQYRGHGHIPWLQIECKEHRNNHIHTNWDSTGRFGRTSGFSTGT